MSNTQENTRYVIEIENKSDEIYYLNQLDGINEDKNYIDVTDEIAQAMQMNKEQAEKIQTYLNNNLKNTGWKDARIEEMPKVNIMCEQKYNELENIFEQ